jgi:hypothetical protein
VSPRWRARRWAVAVFVVLLVPGALLGAPPVTADPNDQPADQQTESAATKTVTGGPYDGLKVTVSQTANLTNQGVVVTWEGGRPTNPAGTFQSNYLQLMQCWGEDENAPDFRRTCQFGAGVKAAGESAGSATFTNSRRIMRQPADPLETEYRTDEQIVPFTSVNPDAGSTPHGGAAQPFPKVPAPPFGEIPLSPQQVIAKYYDTAKTNEIPYALTTGNGTGRAVFEVQTATEAPHLGCGSPVSAGGRTVGRPCRLVVVPRGETDWDGNPVGPGHPSPAVDGSPLSGSWWKHRIVFPLQFAPIGGHCPLGQAERRMVGSELVSYAVASWQPALCANNGPVYGFAEVSDLEAGRQVLSPSGGAPGLGMTSDPVVTNDGDPAVLHAPVALTGAVIAFNVDARLTGFDPNDPRDEGTAVRELKLTPRLVAKLLTSSYRRDVPGAANGPGGSALPDAAHVKDNVLNLRQDPEFLGLNPFFNRFVNQAAPDGLMVSITDSAAAREVWRWILADPAARAWLSGQKDGAMVVNKYYAGLVNAGAPSGFPKSDPTCAHADGTPPAGQEHDPRSRYCVQDLRPYTNSLREAASLTLRADSKSRTVWDAAAAPPALKVAERDAPGTRWSMSITTAPAAAKYGLYLASLCAADGKNCVVPTEASMRTAYGAMVPSGTSGVLAVDPQ